MSIPPLYGGCLCGSVRYEIAAPLGAVEHCHCSMCRKAHGAAFSTNSVVPTAALTIVAGADWISEYESSPNRRKCFCSKCGSQLFIRRIDRPGAIVVALGGIDGDPLARPARHVFVASRAPWYDIGHELPRFKVYPGCEPADEPPAPARPGVAADVEGGPDGTLRIEAAGIVLRPFEDRDAAQFAQAIRESVVTMGPWMSWCHAEYTEAAALDWFEACRRGRAAGTAFEFGVFARDGKDFLGGGGLNLIVRHHGYCNLGYWVRQSRQREGVASACVAALSAFGFRELGLQRIEIVVAVGNEPSAAVARKAGAELECVARNRLLLRGQPVAASVFSLVPANSAG